jgi:hypothetical protein
MALFTFYYDVRCQVPGGLNSQRLTAVCCVLWSGELQGFIIHELVPSWAAGYTGYMYMAYGSRCRSQVAVEVPGRTCGGAAELEQEQENPEHNKLLSLSPVACRFSMYYIPHQVLPCM